MSKTPPYYIGKYKQIHVQEVLIDFELDKHHNLASATEYILRANRKHTTSEQDIRKAIHHLELYLSHPERNTQQSTPKE
jgi:hypothetical protein